ncbi:MAG: hypothetical protein IJH76_02500 [Clostridia bacterium]|nr:hypothetical protein [Clostridia bacterium]
MMHEFCKYSDGTLAVFSDIRKKDNGDEYLIVSFERPTEYGFDTIVFELPTYNIIKKDGNYTEKEIEVFKSVVERGAPFFYETAREGGIQIA